MSTRKDETRVRLLDAARKLLEKRGFHGVALDDIAEAAGVSRQAVYKSHFASKADLLLELVRYVHVAENLDEITQAIVEAPTTLARLEETIGAVVKIEVKLHDLSMVLTTAAVSDEGAARAWRDRVEVKRGALRAALLRVESEGRLSSAWKVEEAVDLLATLVSTESFQQLVVERDWSPEGLIQRVWELCQRSLLVEPKGRTSKPKAPRRRVIR